MAGVQVSFYSEEELYSIGLKSFGKNVKISHKSSFYSPDKIEIGNNVRIDDFCVLSGKIRIGDHVHINAFCVFSSGNGGIILNDFCNISSRVAIYAVSDDYSGEWMTSPLLPSDYTNITSGEVVLERHCIIGTGSTVLPGCRLGIGCAVGAMSLVRKSLPEWGIYAGIPARLLRKRSRKIIDLEKAFPSGELPQC